MATILKKLNSSLIILALSATVLAAVPIFAAAQTPEPVNTSNFTLTILHNNDGESKLLPNEAAGFAGVARFVAQLKQMQTAAASTSDGVITLSAGDNFLASQELSIALAREGMLYDTIALNGLYDAITLGNHDFDFGPDVTARFIEGFDPVVPFLSANADFSAEPNLQALVEAKTLVPSTVIETGGEMVGIIGAVTPALPNISSPRNVVVSEVLAAVSAEAQTLTDQGINKIILVSHLQDVDEEIELVGSLTGVDVVIAGGGDELLRNEDDSCMPDAEPVGPYPTLVSDADGIEVPVITAPGGYRCIGSLTVTFNESGAVVNVQGESVAVGFDITPDADVQANVTEPLTEAVAAIDADVIGTSEVDLDGRRNSVRTTATNQGNLHADSLRASANRLADSFGIANANVAIQNGGGIRNDSIIPAGEITTGDTWDIAPFRNFVVVLEVPRSTFHVLLEQAVDAIPGTPGQFAQVSGFTFTFNPTANARQTDRVGDCSLNGDPGARVRDVVLDDGTVIVEDGVVVPGDPVVLATIDFLANGGDCYPLADLEATNLGVSYQQAIVDYITTELNGEITAADYPVGGDNRIVTLMPEPDPEPEPTPEPTPDPEPEPTPSTDPEPVPTPSTGPEPVPTPSTGSEPGLGTTTGPETAPTPPPTPQTTTITVVRGDTLWNLAKVHLGSPLRWREIFELNQGKPQATRGSLTKPELIHIGWVLQLPAS
ncbi:MAG: 5'-nucleotidase C-terminal domain-containing protein [Acidimicrobiaceae bacterium]|nr:5'-nucleotidase C-terminal domain-containing protein [Acidimicrobiaceae bacterium]